jgi:glutaredoxin
MALDVAENGDRETADDRRATPYRMVMADHVCPYGLKSKDLLERKGYRVEDQTSREETDAFMREHGVETTPQAFIGGERPGRSRQRRPALSSQRRVSSASSRSSQQAIAPSAPSGRARRVRQGRP